MSSLSYLELVFQCAEFHFKSIIQYHTELQSQRLSKHSVIMSLKFLPNKTFLLGENQSLGSPFPLRSFFPERHRVCNFPRIKEFLQENMTYTILDIKHFE